MTRSELLLQLVGPQRPADAVSGWPPGSAWWALAAGLIALIAVVFRYREVVPPFWRGFARWRTRRHYLRRLRAVTDDAEPSVALSHWFRALAADGLGISPALPPGQWLKAVELALGEPVQPGVKVCLRAIYQPEAIKPVMVTHYNALRALCLRCLHLRSPGPRY